MASAPRIYHDGSLTIGNEILLPPAASRHIQVLRLQPGDSVLLFPGDDSRSNHEYQARVTEMGRQHVKVIIEGCQTHNREAPREVHLAVGMPANERMDWLIEKATELGATSLTPLITQRSVLRLSAERALKKQAHWQAIAIAACEQCGLNRLPHIATPISFKAFIEQQSAQSESQLFVLSLQGQPLPLQKALNNIPANKSITVLSGPEGGLSADEEQSAISAGAQAITLGSRILRAETAPLAALSVIVNNID